MTVVPDPHLPTTQTAFDTSRDDAAPPGAALLESWETGIAVTIAKVVGSPSDSAELPILLFHQEQGSVAWPAVACGLAGLRMFGLGERLPLLPNLFTAEREGMLYP
ncbi:MAG: hypothetical protein EOP24_43260 [Hyphomicrobiales bacterium]|nr:MAG: hypothetical protein EOP24_43260 [Hyphomicrobiales bacterium]